MIRKYLNSFARDSQRQQEVIFNWLRNIVEPSDLIMLKRNGKREGYYFDFPLKIGDRPVKFRSIAGKEFTFFVKFSDRPAKIDKVQWKLLFHSPELEVWENKKRFEGKQLKPLRWGLEEEDKKTALKIARESIRIFLEEKKPPQIKDLKMPLAPVFALRADLDVALWVNGAPRGSIVVENNLLAEGIVQAASRASRDLRFKPLEPEELKAARIEITLFSDLKIPLSRSLIEKNEIFYDKGYLTRGGGKEGWFLPAVLNSSRFKDLKEFLSRLALEKASLLPEEIFDKRTRFFVFEVDDFIEGMGGGEQQKPLNLIGPVIVNKRPESAIKDSAITAAKWLLKMQELEGDFIPIANPFAGKIPKPNWPRSILTGWSMIEFGQTVDDPEYVEAGRKNFFYGKKYLLEEKIFKNPGSEALSLAYLGQQAVKLGHWNEAWLCADGILKKEQLLEFEPIIFSQIGSFFSELSKFNQDLLAPALRFAEKTQNAFDDSLRQKQLMQPASWAELANLHLKLYESSRDSIHLQGARLVLDWLMSHQLPDGSFKGSNYGPLNCYTRGTGKIAEVLAQIFVLEKQIDGAFDLVYYEKSLKKAFAWMEMMQYSLENSYFIPQENLALFIGGFRHDYFNQEAWIDSAGHFLLAASRFLKRGES